MPNVCSVTLIDLLDATDPKLLDETRLAPLLALYRKGHFLQAYEAAKSIGPLPSWRGVYGRVMAGRLAWRLGGERLGNALCSLALREHPDHPEALLFAAYAMRARRGPWATRKLMRGRESAFADDAKRYAHWRALQASIAAELRDFSEAELHLADAEKLAPTDAWVQVERSYVCELSDDYSAALAASEKALILRPAYRPAVTRQAHVLRLLNRDDQALSILIDAAQDFECATVLAALLEMQIERESYDAAEVTLARIDELSPLNDKAGNRWLAGRKADVHYYLGDRSAAAAQAREAGNGFYQLLAERLEQPELTHQRVLLPVAFVRQHHMTCAPATISAIARFWGQAAEQLAISEAICYDGTTDQSARAWAEKNGWHVREFTVSWACAVSLLDRGLPFTLSTVEPGSAHMQAVIGYDNLRGTFLIRDPYTRQIGEFAAEPMCELYASTGPRGMVLVPVHEAARLDSLTLPDAALYDDYYEVQTALVKHDRERAARRLASMETHAPSHRMTLFALRSLANYDSDDLSRLRAIDRLLALYPKDVNLRLARQGLLSVLGRREECLDYLGGEYHGSNSHHLLGLSYADLLREDARELEYARVLLRRVVRDMPFKAEAYYKLAHVVWEQGERESALELYRTATNLETTDERFADSYFRAARYLRRTESALQFLQQRFERWGRKSAQPAITLFNAFEAIEQTRRGLDALEQAMIWRPEDGELLLFCAEAWLRNGEFTRAEELLVRAEPVARRADWLQSSAYCAEVQGRFGEALSAWEQASQVDPFNLRAVRAVARLRASAGGARAACEFLETLVTRFPHHYGLNRLYVEWLDDEPFSIVEPALRSVLAINPADARSWRELALKLAQAQRLPEAFEALAKALALAPNDHDFHITHARLLSDSGRDAEARDALRQALRVSVDSDFAIAELIRLCHNVEERKSELAFIHAELMRQVTFGDGLLSYQAAARSVLAAEDLLETLRFAHAERSDLWHAWVALVCQLRDMDQQEEAMALIQAATERFPLLPRVWLEKAELARYCGNAAAQEAGLIQALQISPAWTRAARLLAELYQGQGRLEDARNTLGQSLHHNPRDGVLHGWMADVQWPLGEHAAALESLAQALRLEPGYLWAWETLNNRAIDFQEPQRPLLLAQELVHSRPNDARVWLLLARAETALPAALDAIQHALQLEPRSERAYELRMDLLIQAKQYDAAIDVTQDPVWRGRTPNSLFLRRARVLELRGDQAAAIASLEVLLAAQPDFFPGWEQLCDWYYEVGQKSKYLHAVRQWVRLDPGNHIPHGYLADALLQEEDRASAKLELLRALELHPAYAWAFNRLFSLELEDRAWDAAARMLVLIDLHAAAEVKAMAHLRFAAAREQRAEVITAFETFACIDGEIDQFFDQVLDLFKNAGELSQLDTLLDQLIRAPNVNAQLGRLWAIRCGAGKTRQCKRALDELLTQGGTIGFVAAGAYLRILAKGSDSSTLRRILRKHEKRLRENTDTWAAAGYALLNMGKSQECMQWFRDWRVREDVKPWMLLNAALALRELNWQSEAHEASQTALKINQVDSTAEHQLFLALDAGLAGDKQPLQQFLTAAKDADVEPYFAYLRELCNALLAVLHEDDIALAFNQARGHLRSGLSLYPSYSRDKYLARAHNQVLWHIARQRSRFLPLTVWWFLWLS